MRINTSLAIAAAVLSAAVSGTAFAQQTEERATISVRVADIDFSNRDSARVALGRIQRAADVVCGGSPDIAHLAQRPAFNQCRVAAVKRAVDSLDRPVLNQVAAASSPPIFVASR
jgi:UrcA family protein